MNFFAVVLAAATQGGEAAGGGDPYSPDIIAGAGAFSATTGWSQLGGASISGGTAQTNGTSTGRVQRTAAVAVSAGTYHWWFDLLATDNVASTTISVGGSAIGVVPDASPPGSYEGEGTTAAASQIVQLNAGLESVKQFDNFIVKRVL